MKGRLVQLVSAVGAVGAVERQQQEDGQQSDMDECSAAAQRQLRPTANESWAQPLSLLEKAVQLAGVWKKIEVAVSCLVALLLCL